MTTTATTTAARARDVTKIYGHGQAAVTALGGVDLDIPAGSFTAVIGPSGSGKSTLMHCMASLDQVTSGRIWIGDTEIGSLHERQLTRLRGHGDPRPGGCELRRPGGLPRRRPDRRRPGPAYARVRAGRDEEPRGVSSHVPRP